MEKAILGYQFTREVGGGGVKIAEFQKSYINNHLQDLRQFGISQDIRPHCHQMETQPNVMISFKLFKVV